MASRQTITASVFEHLMGLICSGAVNPGKRLPTEKDLIAELGVSRTCVREAIKSLEALRIVIVRPKSGAIVQGPTAAALFNAELFSASASLARTDILLEFRKIMETGLAALAAEKACPDDLQRIGQTIHDYKECLKNNQPPFQADVAFHAAIAQAAQNPLGQMVLKSIAGPLAEQFKLAESLPGAAEDGLADHLKIFGAIAGRQAEKARSAMLEHLNNAERYWRIANGGLTSQDVIAELAARY